MAHEKPERPQLEARRPQIDCDRPSVAQEPRDSGVRVLSAYFGAVIVPNNINRPCLGDTAAAGYGGGRGDQRRSLMPPDLMVRIVDLSKQVS